MHIPPPVFFAGAWLAQTILLRLRRGSGGPPAVVKASGAAVAATSLALMGGTVAMYGVAGTTVDPVRPDRARALVVTGPNRLTRNPIYLGFAGLLTAHALWRGSAAALLPVAGFVAAMTPQIRREEASLLARFGGAYTEYRRRVPRWVGRPHG